MVQDIVAVIAKTTSKFIILRNCLKFELAMQKIHSVKFSS